MHAEVRHIEANDIADWPNWSPAAVTDEHQWFTVGIGKYGASGSDLFQVAVTSLRWLRVTPRRHDFRGIVVEQFTPVLVEQAIRAFVDEIQAETWDEVVAQLSKRMQWEYDGPYYRNS